MKFLFSILLALLSMAATAQQTYVQLLHDTTTNTYRFQRIEVRQYESLSDTLVTDRFPEKWLTAAELKTYQQGLLTQIGERFTELTRLRKLAKDEFDVQVNYYDGIQGAGAYLALQKNNLKNSLQGAWVFVERNGTVTKTDITVTDFVFRKNQTKSGTLTINDDLSITLAGYFNFNLTFTQANRGVWLAERNGVTYILRK